MPVKSPLRYPGGKSGIVKYIEKVIQCNFHYNPVLIEPFAGGASVSIELLQLKRIRGAILVERDPLIYAFWKSVMDHSNELIYLIEKAEISIETWNELQPLRSITDPNKENIPLLGFAGLFFNRTNFSGILKAGPIGGIQQAGTYKINCRFNKDKLIKAINTISCYCDRVQVIWADAIEFLHNNKRYLERENTFVYIDPPYYDKGEKLYRYFFNDINHIQLSKEIVSARYPWLLSYDSTEFIKRLYLRKKHLNSQSLYFDYSVATSRKAKELLISNLEIPPIEYIEISETIL